MRRKNTLQPLGLSLIIALASGAALLKSMTDKPPVSLSPGAASANFVASSPVTAFTLSFIMMVIIGLAVYYLLVNRRETDQD